MRHLAGIIAALAEVMADDVITAYGSKELKFVARELREGWAAAVFRR